MENLKNYQNSSNYVNKVIVAPMVRVCTLPFRLLAIDYGADLVYTEEIIDWKILRSEIKFNENIGTTDFVDKTDGTVFFRTCEREKSKLIAQVGTSDANRALKVAKLLEPFVSGIDINMGCPKEFSIKGGMGAALLTQPQKIKHILTTLVNGLNIPVTCKIRILPELEDTLSLCKLIESCGVSALAVHGRLKQERPRHPNHDDVIKEISKVLNIPVIANGGSIDISQYSDIERFRERTNSSSVMIARAVMWNCSVLRKEGLLPVDTVVSEYMKYAIQYDNLFTYTKYTVQNMLRDLQNSSRGKAFLESQSLKEIAVLWNLGDLYEQTLKQKMDSTSTDNTFDLRRWGYTDRDQIEVIKNKNHITGETISVHMPMQFIRGNFCNSDLPKMVINRHTSEKGVSSPKFGSVCRDRYFLGFVDIEDVRYETSCIEKNRRYAEQAAGMVYLHANQIVEKSYGFVPSDGSRKHHNNISNDSELKNKTERKAISEAKEMRKEEKRSLEEDKNTKNKVFIQSLSNENVLDESTPNVVKIVTESDVS